MYEIINRIRLKLGIDEAIFWSIINRAFGFVKAPVSIYFIVRYLTPQDQGLWYTFNSLAGLTVFAELGFASIMTQFVSHEYAKLYENKGIVEGDSLHLDRLIGLIRFSLKFYIAVILIAILILITTGYFYFRTDSGTIYLAWFFFSVVGGFNLFIGLLQSIYQGLDKVKEIQINAFIYTLIGTVCNWIMLMLYWKIWALVLGNLIGLIITSILLYRTAPNFWEQVFKHKIKSKFNFFKETIPLQGKYALSWISGYFIFYLYVPATYKYIGPVQAGQLGLTMSVISASAGVATSWLNTKIPKLNMLVSIRNLGELNRIFKSSFIMSIIIQLLLFIGIILSLSFLQIFYPNWAVRFLTIPLTMLILSSQIALTTISSLAIYSRAHKEEPFVYISILGAILMICAVFVVLAHFNMTSFFIFVNIIFWILLLPFSYFIFQSKKSTYLYKYYNK